MARQVHKENLRVPTSEEARRNGRKGGIASARKRKQVKNTRAFFEIIKDIKLPAEKQKRINEFFGTNEEYTFASLNLFNIMQASCEGNPNAMKLINEIDGSMDKDKKDDGAIPANVYVVSSDDVAKAFIKAERDGIAQEAEQYDEDEDEDE